jgi:cysteine desulfurase / selenocysteine lyase
LRWFAPAAQLKLLRVTLAGLLSDEALRQREFPVVRDRVFLAHAGVCPLPRRVAEAVRDAAQAGTRGDQETSVPAAQLRRTRAAAARLIQARPEEIAFVGPTSLALSYVAAGLELQPGDNVLAYFDDYPSNVYPWTALRSRGVEVRWMEPRTFGCLDPCDVEAKVDGRTRLVALASCHFLTGFRPDLAAIGRFLRDRGILFCVDAIQTLGAFPTGVQDVDFLAADAHKWLLGPCAAGMLFVRQAVQDRLRPVVFGWHNVRCPDFVAQTELVLRGDARRYEAGSQNLLGLAGLGAALELIEEVGVDAIATRLLRQRRRLVPALQADGWELLHPDASPRNAGGIVTFRREDTDLPALHARLEAAGIITSLRSDRTQRRYLRVSPHFYNTDAELDRLIEALRTFHERSRLP